jgi:nucleoside-diphosphate-sugar epimerase
MKGTDDGILVTGASGIVGRCVVQELRKSGKHVLPIVRSHYHSSGESLFLDKSVALDLGREDLDLKRWIVGRPQAVVHLAAAVPHSARYPDNEESARLTRTIDANVAEAVCHWDCPVVYMSTCGLYDRKSDRLKSEYDETIIKISSPYFAAKYDGERIFGPLPGSTLFRLAVPIGPGLKKGVVLGRFIDAARNGKPISVWGTGRREQNFVDARDVARAVSMALGHRGAGVINLASRPVTMLELAKTVVEVFGRGDIRLNEQDDALEHDTARYDIRRAGEVLDWQPIIGLRDSLNWIREEPLTE